VPNISRVKIENYKSVETLSFDARRVTLFIGEPNSGKSNLLEALALLGGGMSTEFGRVTRSRQAADLFFDHDVERKINVTTESGYAWTLKFQPQKGSFEATVTVPGRHAAKSEIRSRLFWSGTDRPHPGEQPSPWPAPKESPVRYYMYREGSFQKGVQQYGTLEPPNGNNLPALLYSNKAFRESVSALFRSKGFRLEIRPEQSEILISKEVDDILYSYPFEAISETLRRIVFYKAVLETNQDSVLVLDEPEANTFPFYTKYLAERIALDDSNQFFISTHNPYVLMSIIEKTPKSDLAVHVARMKNYRTELRLLSDQELEEALDLGMDLFLNLDRYFPE
jgi:energy-coupling factor transporter ATP-binding protein EcfA2